MNAPNLSFGQKQEASLTLPPDIGEQSLLARKISDFLSYADILGVEPSQYDREYQGIRVGQPNGIATLALMLTRDKIFNRTAAEVVASHDSPATKVLYTLLPDMSAWSHDQIFPHQARRNLGELGHAGMLADMLEYVSSDELSRLQDANLDADVLVRALEQTLGPQARKDIGKDTYVKPIYSSPMGFDYTSAKNIKLDAMHENKKTAQRLSVSAVALVSSDPPVQIEKKIAYSVNRNHNGDIVQDKVTIGLTSTDGLSQAHLRALINPEDTKFDPLQILDTSLQELSDSVLDENS